MRRTAALLVATFVALTLACGSSQPTAKRPDAAHATPASAATSQPSVTISWSFWGDPQEASIDQRVIQLFEREHPEIHVVPRWAAYGDYLPALEQWWGQGDASDVSFLYDIPAFAARNELLSLESFVQRDHYDLTDFYPGLLDQFAYNGALYGLPRDNDTKVIFYNKDLFDARNLPYPQPGWTWDDLRRDALALTPSSGTGQYGFAFEPQSWWKLWVWQAGGEIFDDPTHPTHTTLDSDATVRGLSFLRDLIYTDHVTPPVEDLASSEQIGSLFISGRLAMAFGNHALVPLLSSTQGLHWGAVGLPAGKFSYNYAGGAGYVISAGSQHKEAAWTFLQWLMSSKGEAIFAESGLIVPSRRSVGRSNLFMHQGGAAFTPSTAANSNVGDVFIAETERGKGEPAFPGSTEINDAIDTGLKPIWTTGADPKATLDALTPRVDALLKAAR